MYLLIDSKANSVLNTAMVDKNDEWSIKDIFPEAEDEYLLVWFEGTQIPENFEIDDSGNIKPLTAEKLVQQGLLDLSPDEEVSDGHIVKKPVDKLIADGVLRLKAEQKVVNNEIVDKSLQEQLDEGLLSLDKPYQYIEDNEIKDRTLEQVLNNNIISSPEEAERVNSDLGKLIEKEVTKVYSSGYELKLTKDYSAWVAAGSPDNDPREIKFLDMQQTIADIKQSFAAQKSQVKALLKQLS